MNPIIQNILNRRSVREFLPDPIPKSTLESLAECAIYAPSGLNRQGWQFTILDKPDQLKKLSALARDFFNKVEIKNDSPKIYDLFKKRASNNQSFSFFYDAPALIISSYEPGNNSAIADCSAAVQNIMLAARSFNIGSCWINTLLYTYKEEVFSTFLKDIGIPENHDIFASVALGYCEHFPSAPKRNKNAIAWAK